MIARPWKAALWWQGLQPAADRKTPGDRAALARLRRCATVAEAMQEVATISLFRHVDASRPVDLPDVALAAAVLAHVRTDVPGTVARLVGPAGFDKPESARLKPLRLRRLMEAEGLDERLIAFRRLVALASGTLPVRDLALSLLDWSDRRRCDWLYDYWNAGKPVVDARLDDAALVTSPAKDPAA